MCDPWETSPTDSMSVAFRPGQSESSPVVDWAERWYTLRVQAAEFGWTPELRRQAGDLRYAIGDLSGAVAHWESAGAAGDDDPGLQRQLAEGYLALERWTDAVQTLQNLLAAQPDDSWAHYQLGLLLAVADPLAAETHLSRSIQIPGYDGVAADLLTVLADDPNDFMRLGLAFMTHEHWHHAELAFRQAAAINHPDPEAVAYLALVRARQGKDGQDSIRQALIFGAEVPQVQYVHGLLLRESGDYEASRNAFAAAISLDPDNPAYYAELGSAYRLLFEYEQAEYWLRVAVATSNHAPEFQELLAVFYAEEGYRLPPESLESVREVQSALPADPDLIAGFAWAIHTMGDTSQALREVDTALALAPDNPAANFYKARILAETGELQEALRLMERVAASNSEYAQDAQRQINAWTIGLD